MSIIKILLTFFLFLIPSLAHSTIIFSAPFDGSFGTVQTCTGSTCPSGFPSMGIVAARSLVSTPPPDVGSGAASAILLPTYTNCFFYGLGPYSGPQCDRAEYEKFGLTFVGDERWYAISVYVDPTYTDTTSDPNGTVISQWHDNPDSCDILKSPHLYLGITQAPYHWRFRSQNDPAPCTTDITVGRVDYDFGVMTPGVWVRFVVHAIWRYDSTGLLEIWMNGVKTLTHAGPNNYNDAQPENWKFGPYKAWWTVHAPASTDTLHIYYDAIKMGDSTSSYDEVSPSPAPPPVAVPEAPSNLRVIPPIH